VQVVGCFTLYRLACFRPFKDQRLFDIPQLQHSKILRFAKTACLFDFYASREKKNKTKSLVFPYTALTDWSL
jgi:hypothetical protein